jgi:hypothetical protein
MLVLPTASEANAQTLAVIADLISTANATFIASTTVLIVNATSLGFYQVFPFVINWLDIPTVTTYFENIGYTVTFPICPNGPFELCGPAAGFPEVIPPGYRGWNCGCSGLGRCRIKISWTSVEGFLQLETGDFFLLEDGVSFIELE